MGTLLALLFLVAQEPPADDIDAAFPSPVAAERQWEVADAYARRIAERIAAGDRESVIVWLQRAAKRLPGGYVMKLSGSATWDITYGLKLAGRCPFTAQMIKEALASNSQSNLAAHLAWMRLCEEGVQAAARDFEVLYQGLAPAERKGIADQYTRMLNELKDLGDTPEGLLALARHVGTVAHNCPATLFILMRRIRQRLAVEKPGKRAILWEAGAMALAHFMDREGADAWTDRAIDEPDSGTRGGDLLLERSNGLFNRGNLEAAEKGYRRLVDNWPTSPSRGAALYNLGHTLRKLRKYGDARAVLDRLIRSDVNDQDPGSSIMETYRNYRGRAVDEIAACHEEEGRWDLALETYQTLGRAHPKVSWCGTCAESMGRERLIKVAHAQAMTGRHEDALKAYVEGLLSSDSGPSPAMIVGLVQVALRLGKLDTVIARFPGRTRTREEILTYVRALRFRAYRDPEGLLKLLAERGRADRWGNLRQVHEGERGIELALEVIELGGSLGTAIIDPLLKAAESEAPLRPWANLMIAAIDSERARSLVQEDRSDWRPRLLKIANSPKRARVLRVEDLEKAEIRRALDNVLRPVEPSPAPIKRMALGPGFSAAAAALMAGVLALIVWRQIARVRAGG